MFRKDPEVQLGPPEASEALAPPTPAQSFYLSPLIFFPTYREFKEMSVPAFH